MKKFIFFLMLLLCGAVLVANGQPIDNPTGAGWSLHVVSGVILGVYELVSRVVKTTRTWSIIGIVINGIKFISDNLDRKTEKKGGDDEKKKR